MTRKLVAFMVALLLCFTTTGSAVAYVAPSGSSVDQAVVNAPPTDPQDESKVPHYFGPYPNWANSPQVMANAVVQFAAAPPVPVVLGNPLIQRTYGTDTATTVFGIVKGTQLPAGSLSDFKVWNQADTPSAGNVFHAYVLRPTANADEYTVVFDSGALTMPSLTDAAGEVATFPVGPFDVLAGDFIGWYGQGIPLDTGVGTDVIAYPGPATAPVAIDVITLGLGSFPIYPEQRTYSIAATVTPNVVDPGTGAEATATVDPKTGGISGVTVTSSGSGYLVPPIVSITAPGMTPTLATAEATISFGVVTGITVDESGFGFAAPQVTISGGNPTTDATAVASGGVDNVTISDGGIYAVQPIVEFSLPDDPAGTRATGTATMDATTGAITAVDVVNAGSGYLTAPTVTIWDADLNLPAPTPAVTVATIGIGRIAVTSGGEGYETAPTVTIRDVGDVDRGASATAAITVRGAVTAITVTDPGAGYLTPGIKKFVDTLPGLGPDAANNLGQYIPVGVPDTTTYPGSDYYEIGLVQYRMKFHSDLPATLLRGYVQLSTTVVPGEQIPLSNANLDPAVAATPIAGYTGVTPPHYLGPTIVASKDRPVRILFRNLLPTGSGGNLFMPVDTSLMGSGPGPNMFGLEPDGTPIDLAADEGSVLDGVRNPVCDQLDAAGEKDPDCYSDNRATLHLHGGITPWISDGTPHQWITPAGEDTSYPEGVSVSNVPDMDVCGPADDGCMTFYYTNQQSARLMFYHDHAWGLTRLNVYAGEAAGYLLTDEMEQTLIAPGGALAGLGLGTPLIIQDKTFLPSAEKVAQQDPTWDYGRWGGEGNLWVPHVYMPAQNPGDPSGMSGFGRWMYGPWFWPPAKDAKYQPIANPYYDPACNPDVAEFCEPALIPATPNISVGMEAFNDTPIVNGTAYPKTTVDPKAYRYRVLNAANDRFFNLSWYVADPTTGTLSEVALNQAEVAAAQTDPVVFPTPDTSLSPKGPSWIQIGTEGGFLPAPVVVPAHETTWITDPTRFDVGLVDEHSLLLAPAERADVIVDFSQFRGKTLILYNDAPAAFPARVPGYDYYTGGPDLSPTGAPTTLPGYGPNTRTVMQVKVSTGVPDLAFDRPNTTADRMGALVAAFAHKTDGTGVFESSMDPIIVGQQAYNSAYGTNFVGNGYCNAATNPTARCDGFARIDEQGGELFKFDTLGTDPANSFGPQLAIPLQPKGIHDEMNSASFDEWGRMTANMGLEAPSATPTLQNINLYQFVNPPTELLDSSRMPSSLDVTPISTADDGTQIWKITHNGVDTHPLHFHLYNVQLLNRVAWDNNVKPPDPTELGWKDTVRVSPLEDTYVALRPIIPVLPWEIPNSVRLLSPMYPEGAKLADSTLADRLGTPMVAFDPLGEPIDIFNHIVNFGWEYVWHCHILSHEEMDMMRPQALAIAPNAAPSNVGATRVGNGGSRRVDLTWQDNSVNETEFTIERATSAIGPWTAVVVKPSTTGPATGATVTASDPIGNTNQTFFYRVLATNVVGDTWDYSDPAINAIPPGGGFETITLHSAPSDVAMIGTPTNLAATLLGNPIQVRLTWTDNSTAETGFSIERADNGGAFAVIATAPPRANTGAATFFDVTVATGNTYAYRIKAVAGGASTGFTNTATVTVPSVPAAPSGFVAANGPNGNGNSRTVILTWVDDSVDETGFTIQRATNATFTSGLNTANVAADATTLTQTGLGRNTNYYYRIRANNGTIVSSAWVNATPSPILTNP